MFSTTKRDPNIRKMPMNFMVTLTCRYAWPFLQQLCLCPILKDYVNTKKCQGQTNNVP